MILIFPLLLALGFMSYLGIPILETALAWVFTALAWVLKLLLAPIDYLIETTMPNLANGLDSINAMFDIAMTYMAYILDASLIPQQAVILVVSYYLFAGGATFFVWTIKLVLKWRRALFV